MASHFAAEVVSRTLAFIDEGIHSLGEHGVLSDNTSLVYYGFGMAWSFLHYPGTCLKLAAVKLAFRGIWVI